MTTKTYTEYQLVVTATNLHPSLVPSNAVVGPYLTEAKAVEAYERITANSTADTATFEIQEREVTVTEWATTQTL